MKYYIFVSLIIISTISPATSADTLALDDYIKKHTSKNRKNLIAQDKNTQSKQDAKAANSLFTLDLDATPTLSKTKFNFPGNLSYDKKNYLLESTLTQKFITGTDLSLGATYDVSERSDKSIDQTNYSYTFTLSQSLLQNSLGAQNFALAQYRDSLAKSATTEALLVEQSECLNAVLLFNKAYSSQVKSDLILLMSKQSKQVWEVARRNYKKRLTNKLTYLSAQADWLNMKDSVQEYLNRHNSNKADMVKWINVEDTIFLSPFKTVNIKLPEKFGREHSYQSKIADNKVKAQTQYYNYIKSKNKSAINLFAQAGKGVISNDFSFSTTGDNDNYFIKGGVAVSLSIFDKAKDLESANALIEKRIAEHERSQEREKELISEIKLTNTLDYLAKAIKNGRKKIEIYDLRSQEAKRKLISGKIEFQDYVSYRDAYLQERISLLDKKHKFLEAKMELISLSQTNPNFCKVK